MLRLENIVKTYKVADQEVAALKGLSLSFRKSEFVSILGPSGCGKTTTLNIIGGLDKYTSGDLFINGRSTKEYSDRDWDVYRNHRVGFIFQAYNLIPHQTILENVELALTIAGMKKAERVQKCKDALDKVGLKGQYNKKPNQLSGGQCQRVAIARALVNNPEILLADEPTGALDTQTSIQIMELIKEISKEKLVIMVTHNPELAEKYSTRIVKLLDGELLSDSNPFSPEDEILEVNSNKEEVTIKENAKMSFWTAFKLSARNLISKLKRTLMVVLAGSIGIIGVSAVLAVSTGVKGYIKDMQDDMLSGNPITISKTAIDLESVMSSASAAQKVTALTKGDWVNVDEMIAYLTSNYQLLNSMIVNNEFSSDYVNFVKSMPSEYYSAIALNYGFDITPNIYTQFNVDNSSDNSYNRSMSLHAITANYTTALEQIEGYSQYASVITSLTDVMSQCIPSNDYISTQYDVVAGTLPKNENDILIVLDENSALSDLMLTQLGYFTQEEFFNIIYKSTGQDYDEAMYKNKFSYDDFLNSNKTFTWYANQVVYNSTGDSNNPFSYNYQEEDISLTDSKYKIDLNICGIVTPKSNISYGCLTTGFLYSEDLARTIISINKDSDIASYVKEKDSLSYGKGLVSYTIDYVNNNNEVLQDLIYLGESSSMYTMMNMFSGASSVENTNIDTNMYKTMSLRYLGCEELPESISIYPVDFNHKDLVTDYLDKWNSKEDITINEYDENYKNIIGSNTLVNTDDKMRNEIKYTDSVGLIISMINTMINIVTYALVAFTALSLVVSTVMVGIITYVSVVERVKEIGVIRSLGGRKKDVSHLFNAETFMIGLSSGLFGILFTALLSFIINVIVRNVSGGAVEVIADLTFTTSIVMILLSVLLTLISGLIPARSAAHKNPVDALRSE